MNDPKKMGRLAVLSDVFNALETADALLLCWQTETEAEEEEVTAARDLIKYARKHVSALEAIVESEEDIDA